MNLKFNATGTDSIAVNSFCCSLVEEKWALLLPQEGVSPSVAPSQSESCYNLESKWVPLLSRVRLKKIPIQLPLWLSPATASNLRECSNSLESEYVLFLPPVRVSIAAASSWSECRCCLEPRTVGVREGRAGQVENDSEYTDVYVSLLRHNSSCHYHRLPVEENNRYVYYKYSFFIFSFCVLWFVMNVYGLMRIHLCTCGLALLCIYVYLRIYHWIFICI